MICVKSCVEDKVDILDVVEGGGEATPKTPPPDQPIQPQMEDSLDRNGQWTLVVNRRENRSWKIDEGGLLEH
jgi:hypothetical protein